MPDRQLHTYLNHHIAATVSTLEALEHLGALQKGTPSERVFTELRAEVAADRRVLEELMSRLQMSTSGASKAAAWLGEKFSWVRLQMDERQGRSLHLLEALESLSMGIETKRSLWVTLAAAAPDNPALQGLTYDHLIRRAEEQRQRLEKLRLDAARDAFSHH